MDYRNNKHTDTWDDSVYGTGNTSPPKSHSGIIALLLILVIFLSGIISVLSFMNIKLFQQLTQQQKQEEHAHMAFADLDDYPSLASTAPTAPSRPERTPGDISIQLNKSPQSVDSKPQEDALSWQEIYRRNIPSVAAVEVTGSNGTVCGSAVVLSPRGYLVTACSLVADAETISVSFQDGSSFSALVVGADSLTDLAVLFVDAPDLRAALFGDSDALMVGDPVAALGNSLDSGLSGTLTDGMIRGISRDVPFLGKNITLIQSSAVLTPENTGGPLINCYGQVIGIHTSAISPEETEGAGCAIPSTTVKEIVDQLIAQGYVSGRPTLGLTGESVTLFDQAYFHIPQGLYLSDVAPDSQAWAWGIRPGDILLRLDGEPVTQQRQLDTLVNTREIGDRVDALFFRDGKEELVTLTVTEYTG